MEILQAATAGNVEKGDVLVTVSPGQGGIDLTISSSVIHQFGRRIREVVLQTLQQLGVENVQIALEDQGALDYVLKARVECALYRACGTTEGILWGGMIP